MCVVQTVSCSLLLLLILCNTFSLCKSHYTVLFPSHLLFALWFPLQLWKQSPLPYPGSSSSLPASLPPFLPPPSLPGLLGRGGGKRTLAVAAASACQAFVHEVSKCPHSLTPLFVCAGSSFSVAYMQLMFFKTVASSVSFSLSLFSSFHLAQVTGIRPSGLFAFVVLDALVLSVTSLGTKKGFSGHSCPWKKALV